MISILSLFKTYWKIGFLLLLVVLCVIIPYIFSKHKDTFANKQYNYGICIYSQKDPDRLNALLTYLQELNNDNLKNTLFYIIDNHSDIAEITSTIENYDIKDVEIKKERNQTVLNDKECILKGYTLLYPKCQCIMHINSDEFDNYTSLVDIFNILDALNEKTVVCNEVYSCSYFRRNLYPQLTDIIHHIPDISGDKIQEVINNSYTNAEIIVKYM